MARYNRIDARTGGHAKTLTVKADFVVKAGYLVGVGTDGKALVGEDREDHRVKFVVKEKSQTEGYAIGDSIAVGESFDIIVPESGQAVVALVASGEAVVAGTLFGSNGQYATKLTAFDGTQNDILVALETVAAGASDQLVKFAFL